jgi:hypothetical protein
VFYLKCDKEKDSSSYQVYIEFCYFYVLVFLFFYKIIIVSNFYFSFGLESVFLPHDGSYQ